MIGQLRGRLVRKTPTQIILDVGGVGYRVFIPLSTYYQLPEDSGEVLLYTSTHLREDALHLYGFLTEREKALFDLLRSVSGIGPRLATNILSGITVEELTPAIFRGDLHRLSAVPGVGRKTAERIILELKEKVQPFLEPEEAAATPAREEMEGVQSDVVSALVNLGYTQSHAAKAVTKAARAFGGAQDFEKLIKQALRVLSEQTKG